MNSKMINGAIAFVFALMAAQTAHAQGTTYLSSLSPTATSSLPVGSDYWLAAGFFTGTNADGYVLDSVQLALADGSGSPSGFTAMIYAQNHIIPGAVLPGSSLGTLNGSLNPVTSGIYTYTPASSLALSPSTPYFIVLTAGTTVANGAYWWNQSAFPPGSTGVWGADNAVLHSSDGISDWFSDPYPYPYSGLAQFSITATAVPEPRVLSLFALGGLCFLWRRRRIP
jgi:hypothetical protein